MEIPNMSSIKIVKNFIDNGSSRPTTTSELMEFWKSLTDAEKLQFTQEAASLS